MAHQLCSLNKCWAIAVEWAARAVPHIDSSGGILTDDAQFARARLARLLRNAADGRFPAADGGVTVLPQPSARDAGVLRFTAHAVVFAHGEPDWGRRQLPPGDLRA